MSKICYFIFLIILLSCSSIKRSVSNLNQESQLFVNEYGSGEKTIILIHGGPSLFGYMKSLGNELKDNYRIVDYAQRGTVESRSDSKVSLDLHIKDLKDLIDKYSGNSKVILIGHSWGANLGLLTIAKCQGAVEKLIVIGTAALNEKISDKHGDTLNSRYTDEVKKELESIEVRLEKASSDNDKNVIMEERLALTSPFYHLDPRTESKVPKSKWNFSTFLESIDSLWDLIDEDKIPLLLSQISDPVIAFHGDTDPIPMDDTFEFLKKNIKGIKTVKVKKSGHFPWLEETSRSDFLEQLKIEL